MSVLIISDGSLYSHDRVGSYIRLYTCAYVCVDRILKEDSPQNIQSRRETINVV